MELKGHVANVNPLKEQSRTGDEVALAPFNVNFKHSGTPSREGFNDGVKSNATSVGYALDFDLIAR
eukprot:CAMPEP_0183783092 /NCGR_PEP_ID=MMETSP0739-20130205/62674_1 /TAXON_ID=385413 /ORGANISM="Thalassiosira miniscula, Strain CCMP1093" /LENGTH=65 /DNA_ID=CAMNT_0026026687 /DNA_START=14 /DNA_END=208 /DNA_ORIENTATION=+